MQTMREEAMTYYVEYASGYCTVVESESREEARAKAGRSQVPGDSIRRCRPAAEEEMDWVLSSGGAVR